MLDVKFDKTINLGHVLTFIGFVAAIWTSQTAMTTRLVLVEERQRAQELKNNELMLRIKELQVDAKQDMQKLSNSMEKLSDRLSSVRVP